MEASDLAVLFRSCLLLCLSGLSSAAQVSEPEYAKNDPERCLTCHDAQSEKPATGILHSVHAQRHDARSPFAQGNACQSCHGPSALHLRRDAQGKRYPPAITFATDEAANSQNAVCLSCHQKGTVTKWLGSRHQFEDLRCVDCHRVHTDKDPMLGKQQQDNCLSCHKAQKGQISQFSRHPLEEGLMRCSDCHNAHGGASEPLLAKTSLNETCYGCHSEKRGPFLWEHSPVREDCSQCHKAHGSNHPNLLVARTPWLCQQCHIAAFHPSTAYSGTGLPNASPSQSLLAQSCSNCHAQVHGSNHPSGVRQTR